jgi:hypothetical protein
MKSYTDGIHVLFLSTHNNGCEIKALGAIGGVYRTFIIKSWQFDTRYLLNPGYACILCYSSIHLIGSNPADPWKNRRHIVRIDTNRGSYRLAPFLINFFASPRRVQDPNLSH